MSILSYWNGIIMQEQVVRKIELLDAKEYSPMKSI